MEKKTGMGLNFIWRFYFVLAKMVSTVIKLKHSLKSFLEK